MKYQYLLFDLDGTLFDFNAAEAHAFEQTCQRYRIPFSEKLMALYHEINIGYWRRLEKGEITREELMPGRFRTFFEALGYHYDGAEANLCYRGYLGEGNQMMPDALSVCRKLSERYSLSLITNGATVTQKKRLKDSPITRYFPKIFISEEIGIEKPQRGFFEVVLRELHADRENCLVIGDSLTSDIRGGKNSGIDTCWIRADGTDNPYEDLRPTYEIEKLTDLLKLL